MATQPPTTQSLFLRLPVFADHLRCNVCGTRPMEVIEQLYLLPAEGEGDSVTVALVVCPQCHQLRIFLADEL